MKINRKIGLFFVCKFLVIGMLFFIFTFVLENNNDLQKKIGIFTAYTATVSQTDSSPTITASNKKISEGMVANNCLPFGTKIKVNDKIFEIQDRMNVRHGCDRFDIYMHNYSDAIDFGIKKLKYELI